MATLAFSVAQATTARTLDIYFIDVEGGQSTLLVTPDGQSLLIDTGYAGNGMTDAKPGNPKQARDPNRIVAAARDSGIKQIDYLLITHFHRDHDGGVPELAQLMPIRNFIDHGTIPPDADSGARGSMQAFNVYAAVRDNAHHIEPKPGDRLPLQSVDAVVVSSAASILANPLAGAGETNAACGPSSLPPDDSIENPRSTGVVVSFGKFRFLDVGDLSGQPLFGLACPKDLIGPVGVYVVAHHGGADIADPATFTAFRPRIALMNNGLKKGGALETYALLHHVRGLEDVWQLHRSEASGEENFPAEHIANLDESTAYWIKLSASEDGSFRVFNGRTGEWKSYPPR
jgi:beta-lactamase superfamily II metal-dependent hydrolase